MIRDCVVALAIAVLCAACTDDQAAFDVDPDPTREAIVREFVFEHQEASTAGDFDWLVARMHPGTFDYWSEATCRETLEFKHPFPGSVQEILAMEYYSDFYFDFGGERRLNFTDLYWVSVIEDSDDGLRDRFFTVAFVEGEPKWFGNCDLPVGL